MRMKEKEKEKEAWMVDWTKLPVELWGEIGQRLVSRLDVERFKAVCKKCRSSLPSPNRFPLWVPSLPDLSDFPPCNVPYFITEVNIYSVDVGSETEPQQVLMEFEELDKGSKFRPMAFVPHGAEVDFFSNKPRKHGPRLSFVAKSYRLLIACDSLKKSRSLWYFKCIRDRVSKTVLISSNANGADQASYALASHHLSIVARFVEGGKLALLRLGGSQDPHWDWVTGFCTHAISDIATYKGKLCAIDCKGRTFLMDYHSLRMTQIAEPPSSSTGNLSIAMQLFNADGELYLVTYRNWGEPKVDAKVFKLSGRLRKWVEVDDTGNRVFLRADGYNVSIPRDVLTRNYGSWMMKYKGLGDSGLASLVLPQDHIGDEDDSCYCFIEFCMKYLPWFLSRITPTAPSKTTVSTILTMYDNHIDCRTNVLHLLTCPPSSH